MQRMPIVAIRDGNLILQKMQWWLILHWSKDGKIKATTFNAKAGTLDQSKLFVPYFKLSRCLVPADAFYEWQRMNTAIEVRGCCLPEKIHLHSLRHSYASWLIQSEISLVEIQKLPGYSSVTTTQIYAHLDHEHLRNAVEKIQLLEFTENALTD